MRPSFHILILFLLTLQVGCAAMQPTDSYAPVVGRQTFLPFTSPEPPTRPKVDVSGEPLTLDRCIEVALANNPELAATSREVSATGSRVEIFLESVPQAITVPPEVVILTLKGEPMVFVLDGAKAILRKIETNLVEPVEPQMATVDGLDFLDWDSV